MKPGVHLFDIEIEIEFHLLLLTTLVVDDLSCLECHLLNEGPQFHLLNLNLNLILSLFQFDIEF